MKTLYALLVSFNLISDPITFCEKDIEEYVEYILLVRTMQFMAMGIEIPVEKLEEMKGPMVSEIIEKLVQQGNTLGPCLVDTDKEKQL